MGMFLSASTVIKDWVCNPLIYMHKRIYGHHVQGYPLWKPVQHSLEARIWIALAMHRCDVWNAPGTFEVLQTMRVQMGMAKEALKKWPKYIRINPQGMRNIFESLPFKALPETDVCSSSSPASIMLHSPSTITWRGGGGSREGSQWARSYVLRCPWEPPEMRLRDEEFCALQSPGWSIMSLNAFLATLNHSGRMAVCLHCAEVH